MNNEFIRRSGLLVAGPATGKSFLQSDILKKYDFIKVLDDESITQELFPLYYQEAMWRIDKVGSTIRTMRDYIVGNEIRQTMTGSSLAISGTWSPHFLTAMFPTSVLGGIFVGRLDPEEIVRLSTSRGRSLPLALAEKFVEQSLNLAPLVFEHVIWLPNNCYLADVVEVCKTVDGVQFKPTELGQKLIDSNIRSNGI